MEKEIRDSLRKVVDYLHAAEEQNWRDNGGTSAPHIYHDVKCVWYWLRDEYRREENIDI